MGNNGKLLQNLRRRIAIILAIVLAFPNTAVAQHMGVGVVTAKADVGIDRTFTFAEAAAHTEDVYIHSGKSVIVNADDGPYFVWMDAEAWEGAEVHAPEYGNGAEVSSVSSDTDFAASKSVVINEETLISLFEAEIEEYNGAYHLLTNSDSAIGLHVKIDDDAPDITSVEVNGVSANEAGTDTETTFYRAVESEDGTVAIDVRSTDDSNVVYTYTDSIEGGTDEDGYVSGLGRHNITITATDEAGNTASTSITVEIWLQETATISTVDTIYYGTQVSDNNFVCETSSYLNEQGPVIEFSYDGVDPEEDPITEWPVAEYYARAKYGLDDNNFSLPIVTEWVSFEVEKATATVEENPGVAEDKTYDGQDLQLFTSAGISSEGSSLHYYVGTTEGGKEVYDDLTSITGAVVANAGEYFLSCKAISDDPTSCDDSALVALGSVTVSQAGIDEEASSLSVNVADTTATLTATVAKPESLEYGAVPDGTVTFKVFVNGEEPSTTIDTVDLTGGTITETSVTVTTTYNMTSGNEYEFFAVYDGGNYKDAYFETDAVDLKGPEITAKCEANGTVSGNITVSSDELATLYYVVSSTVLDDMDTPDEVVTGAEQGVTNDRGHGIVPVEADEPAVIDITNLYPDSTYYVWLVAKDAKGNYSPVISDNFITDGVETTATISINEANLHYVGTISAAIDDPDNNFSAASITYDWYVDDEKVVSHFYASNNENKLTDTFDLNNPLYIEEYVTVIAKPSGCSSITASSNEVVAKQTLTPTLAPDDGDDFIKVYDATTSLEDGDTPKITLDGDVKDGDVVDVAAFTATYASKNVSDNAIVSANNLTLAGASADYYQLSTDTVTAVGKITPKVLTSSDVITPDGYDTLSKSQSAAVFTPRAIVSINNTSILDDDDLKLACEYDTEAVNLAENFWNVPGVYDSLTVTLTLAGEDADNYTFESSGSDYLITPVTATITGEVQIPINDLVTAINAAEITKVYDNTVSGESVSVDMLVNGVPLKVLFDYEYANENANENAGTVGLKIKTLSAQDTADPPNPYTIKNKTSVLNGLKNKDVHGTITKKPIAIADMSFNNDELSTLSFSKIYDGLGLSANDIWPRDTDINFINDVIYVDDEVSANVIEADFGAGSPNVAVYSDSGSAKIELSGAQAGNYKFDGSEVDNELTISGLDGEINQLPLSFGTVDPSTVSFAYSPQVVSQIKGRLLEISNAVVGDELLSGFAVTFDEITTSANEAATEITKEGKYEVTVTATGNDNYALPENPMIGTIEVTGENSGATAAIECYDPNIEGCIEYGDTINATIDVVGTPLRNQSLNYWWVDAETEQILKDSSNIDCTGAVNTDNYDGEVSLAIDNHLWINKSVKFVAKLDGYQPVVTESFNILPRTLTLKKVVGSTTKEYDGDAGIEAFDDLRITFVGNLAGETVSVKATEGTFNDANASTGKTIQLTGFTPDDTDADKYRIQEDAVLTGVAQGTITPKYINVSSTPLVKSTDYNLYKKAIPAQGEYIEDGEVTFGTNDPAVSTNEILTLVPNLYPEAIDNPTGVRFASDEHHHDVPGTYNDGIVTYTLCVQYADSSADPVEATNYTFSNLGPEAVTTVEEQSVKCVVSAETRIEASDVVAAINAALSANSALFDKTYDQLSANDVRVTVGDYVVTIPYKYEMNGDVAYDPVSINKVIAQSLTATDVTAVATADPGAHYELTNKDEIINAFNETFTGTITPIILSGNNIKVGNEVASASTISYTKTYDGEALTIEDSDAYGNLHVESVDGGTTIIEGDDLSANIIRLDISGHNADSDVFSATGEATIGLIGDDAGNYAFGYTNGITEAVKPISGVPVSITARELEFVDDPFTTAYVFTDSDLAPTISADAIGKVKSGCIVGNDEVDFTLKFKALDSENQETGDYLTAITDAGNYHVYVATVTNTNYAVPSGSIGTVTVNYGELTGTVTISGNAMVGETLSVVTELPDGVENAYAWYYANVDLTGVTPLGTEATYTVKASDYNNKLIVVVSDNRAIGFEGSVTSAPSATIAAKTIEVSALDPSKVVSYSPGLEYDGTATRTATITNEAFDGMESGYYGLATLTFGTTGSVNSIPTAISDITVMEEIEGGDDVPTGAYVINYTGTIGTDLSGKAITKLTAAGATATDTVFIANQTGTFDFTDKVADSIKALTDNGVTLEFADITPTGDARGCIINPTATFTNNEFKVSYGLSANVISSIKTATVPIRITDGTNYDQDITLTLTVCPDPTATVEITAIGTNFEVPYGNDIIPTVTVNDAVTTQGVVISYTDSQDNPLSQTPTAVGSYKMVASYTNGNVTGSAVQEFAITALQVAAPVLSGATITYDGTEKAPEFTTGGTSTTGYTLTGDLSAYNAGDYSITATLAEGYEWTSGGTDDKVLSWNIVKANSGTFTVGDDVTGSTESITGLNAYLKYQYASVSADNVEPDDSAWTEVTGQSYISGLSAGTYAIRISNSNWEQPALATTKWVTVTASSGGGGGGGGGGTPEEKNITGITVTPNTAKVAVGKTTTLTAALVPADATETATVTWTTSDKTVATVANGVVTGVKVGTATITASVIAKGGTFTATCAITVEDPSIVTGITVTPATATLEKEKTLTLTAVLEPEGQTENPAVTWTTSDATVATVTGNGTSATVTAVKEGKATITASVTSKSGQTYTATSVLTIKEKVVEVTGITINPATATVGEEKTVTLTAVLAPADQTEDPTVTWTTSDATVATVANGVVKGVKEGTATITATVTGAKGTFSATCAVTVTKKIVEVENVTLNNTMVSIKKGSSVTLTATVVPDDATDKTVTWSTGNSAIASVANGVVTGVKAGTTTITATAGTKSATAIVTVTEEEPDKEDEQVDLTDLIKDTEDGTKLADVIKDVITETEKGEIETKIWVGGLESSYPYTGKAQKPTFHVYDGVTQLVQNTDYTTSYKNNTKAGTAEITIKFKGNYKGTNSEKVNFTISKINLGECTVPDVAVNSGKSPSFSVTAANGLKVPEKAFSVSYESGTNLKEAGEYTATLTAKDTTNYEGTATATVTVIGKNDKSRNLANGSISVAKKVTWTGEALEPVVTVKDAVKNVVDPSKYEVAYINNVEVGTATVVVTANDSSEDGYVGAKSATFKIENGRGEVECTVEESVEYSAAGAKAAVIVTDKDSGDVLREGTDYTLKYSKNKGVTTAAEVKITGKGKYKFSQTLQYAITAKDIDKVAFTATDVVGTKNWNKTKVNGADGGKNLGKKDFEITGYTVNGSPATSAEEGSEVTVEIKAKGSNYTGTTSATYHVIAEVNNIGKAKMSKKIANKVFNGGKVTLTDKDLTDILTLNGKTLVPGTDFEVTGYSNNNKKGTAKVTVVGKDNGTTLYGGTKTMTFKIVQKTIDWKQNGKTFIDGEWK